MLNAMLSLSSVKKALNNIFTCNMNGEEAVKSPISHAPLHRELLPAKLLPLISEVVSNDGDKTSVRKGGKLKNTSSKVWSTVCLGSTKYFFL